MRKFHVFIVCELESAGVVPAALEYYPGEGYVVRVGSVREVFAAETVAAKIKADYGIEVYVAF